MLEKRLDNSNLLWVTRGRKWGFRYLSNCSLLAPYLDVIYKKLFLSDESRLGYWKGNIVIDRVKTYSYIACRCYDNKCEQYDDAGRRIPHEFLLLCSNEDYNELSGICWETMLLDNTRQQYLDLFECISSEIDKLQLNCCIKICSDAVQCESYITLDIFISSIQEPTDSTISPISKWIFCGIVVIYLVFFFFCYNSKKKAKNYDTIPEDCNNTRTSIVHTVKHNSTTSQ